MKHTTYSWISTDNKNLFAQCWESEESNGKSVLFVHGLGEHSGRYETWAKKFCENGYNFLAIDLHGHGRTEGKQGHAKSLSVLLDDIDLMFDHAAQMFAGHKLILYGHSMGGNLVLNHIIRRNRHVDAVIVTSPWLKLYSEPSYASMILSTVMKRIYPSMTVKTPLKPEQLSHDQGITIGYASDPLVHNKISLRIFFELYDSGNYALRNVYKINHPFLIMHGTADTITSHKASESFVMNTSKRTRLKLWDGQYHELHNELISDEVFDYIQGWLKEYNL